MKVLVRGISPEEEVLLGKCYRCQSYIEVEQSEMWEDKNDNYLAYCPVCSGENISGGFSVKLYLETSTEGKNLRVKSDSIRRNRGESI